MDVPFFGGKQGTIDTTVISTLIGRGRTRGRIAGPAVREAKQIKYKTFPELVNGKRCRRLGIASEVAG